LKFSRILTSRAVAKEKEALEKALTGGEKKV